MQLRDQLRGSIEVGLRSDEVLIDVIRGVGVRVAVNERTPRDTPSLHSKKDGTVYLLCALECVRS